MLMVVALPVPLYSEFDYLLNPESAIFPAVGSRVLVPFGSRKLTGIITAHKSPAQADVSADKLKTVIKVLDNKPIISLQILTLAKWLAKYYHHPIGDVLSVMLPTLIRQGKTAEITHVYWQITKGASVDSISTRALKQRQQFLLLSTILDSNTDINNKNQNRDLQNSVEESVLLVAGIEKSYLKKLLQAGLIASSEITTNQTTSPTGNHDKVSLIGKPLELNKEQKSAVDSIILVNSDSLETTFSKSGSSDIIESSSKKIQAYEGFLLNGVTGSGKTEVYLQAMQPILTQGKQVLILVPEIGLTPQTKERFAKRFQATILLLHSNINDSSRMQGWLACKNGQAQIIIGTRSTLLYPFANLGMIIVDEAHDASYKQQDRLKYHAADVALYRGLQQGIPVVLGTATPTFEQLKLVTDGKLTELTLKKRAGGAKPPRLKLVDARSANMAYITQPDGREQNTGLTESVVSDIKKTLQAGNQVLVFLNRRGYAPVLLCDGCGWQADCPHCDAHLTVHKLQEKQKSERIQPTGSIFLRCHHCGWQAMKPSHCPDCTSSNLAFIGIGTSRLTESLHAIFANPQTSKVNYPIIQIDRDSTRQKDSWQRIYQQINNDEPSILIGTQMVAKGHHFPKVTLVVMPNADRGFLSSNFRSPEHTAQLMMQVAGRAGRGESEGTVLIQTIQPDNPLLLKLMKEGYLAFAHQLLAERELLGLPPYVRACIIRCEGNSQKRTYTALQDAMNILPRQHKLSISGVIDAPMAKKNGRYHSHLLLLSNDRQHLHAVISVWWQRVLVLPSAKYLRLTLDVDPIGW